MNKPEQALKPISEFIFEWYSWHRIHVADLQQSDLATLPEGLEVGIEVFLPTATIKRSGADLVTTIEEDVEPIDEEEGIRLVRAWSNAAKILATDGQPFANFKAEESLFLARWDFTVPGDIHPEDLLKRIVAAHRLVSDKVEELLK